MDAQGGKFLTFILKNETYGIPINKVKEIIGMMEITEIPKVPQFIKGVINLRGRIIPIMDLRLKLGMERRDYSERTCIIIIEFNLSEEKKNIGIVVDIVSEVVNIQSENIDEPPKYGAYFDEKFLDGIAKVKDKVILLLNTEGVLKNEEIEIINKI